MNNEQEHIDLNLKEAFKGHEQVPDIKYQNNLNKRLRRFNFFRAGWSHFNIYYVLGSMAVIISGIVLLNQRNPEKNVDPAEQNIPIEKFVPDTISLFDEGTDQIINTTDSAAVGTSENYKKEKVKQQPILKHEPKIQHEEFVDSLNRGNQDQKTTNVDTITTKPGDDKVVIKRRRVVKKDVVLIDEEAEKITDTIIKKKKNGFFKKK